MMTIEQKLQEALATKKKVYDIWGANASIIPKYTSLASALIASKRYAKAAEIIDKLTISTEDLPQYGMPIKLAYLPSNFRAAKISQPGCTRARCFTCGFLGKQTFHIWASDTLRNTPYYLKIAFCPKDVKGDEMEVGFKNKVMSSIDKMVKEHEWEILMAKWKGITTNHPYTPVLPAFIDYIPASRVHLLHAIREY